MIDHTRHLGIFYADNYSATLIGAGGIGAITAITLGKMGLGNLFIFDGDSVDDVNIATQFHKISDIGKNKAEAVSASVKAYAGLDPTFYAERIQTTNLPEYNLIEPALLPPTDIIISSVDSIKSRKDIYAAVLRNWEEVRSREHERAFLPNWWYIDARMASEYLQMYVLQYGEHYWYTDTLKVQNDEDIPDEPCTSKATIYTACLAAGVIGAAVRRIITGDQKSGILTYDIFKNHMSFLEMEPYIAETIEARKRQPALF